MVTLTTENFEKEVLQAQQPVLVEFSAPWCVYCRRIEPVLHRMDGKSDILIATINTDDQPELAQRFGVEVIPTFYLFQDGKHGEKLIAPGSQAQLEEWIASQRG